MDKRERFIDHYGDLPEAVIKRFGSTNPDWLTKHSLKQLKEARECALPEFQDRLKEQLKKFQAKREAGNFS